MAGEKTVLLPVKDEFDAYVDQGRDRPFDNWDALN